MTADINTKEKEILTLLDQDIKVIKKELKEIVDAIIKGGYSKFPVLISHLEDISIAQKVIDKETHQTHFNYSASILEELVHKGVIVKEKQTSFEQRLTSNKKEYCLLLLHPDVMKFVFLPLK